MDNRGEEEEEQRESDAEEMNVIMDNRLEQPNSDIEVKKLRELVKQLEDQNLELRTEKLQLMKEVQAGSPVSGSKDDLSANTDLTLEETSNIMLDEANFSDEETWLVDSPITKPASTAWLRKDVDDPSISSIKKSLLHKLDDIREVSLYGSPRHTIPYTPCQSSPESPPSYKGKIDTKTYVRTKKKAAEVYGEGIGDENRNSLLRRDGMAQERMGHSSGSLCSEDDGSLSSASESSYSYQLADVADVNALARLQEESLKLPEPRRSRIPGVYGSSTSNHNTPGGSTNSSLEDLQGVKHPPTGSPRRLARGLQPPRQYSTRLTSREGSDLSTPPDSPYNSQHNLEIAPGRSGSRLSSLNRGLGGSDPHMTPNSSRGTSPARSYDADGRHSARTSRLQAPQMRSRLNAPSPVSATLAGASGIAQPMEVMRPKPTNMPRRVSRLQPPKARSGLVQPRYQSPSMDDWRDGCF